MKKKAYITPKLVIVDVELENELLATSDVEMHIDDDDDHIWGDGNEDI